MKCAGVRICGASSTLALSSLATCSCSSAAFWCARWRTLPLSGPPCVATVVSTEIIFNEHRHQWHKLEDPAAWKLELGTAHVKATNTEHSVPKPRVTGWTWLGKQWPSAKGPRSIRKTRRSLEEFTGGLIPWTRCVPIFGPALKRGEAKQSMKGILMMVMVMMTTMIMLMMTTASVIYCWRC